MKINVLHRYKSLNTSTKAALWFAGCGILQKGIQFITTPIFTRILTTEQYGEVSIYLSWYNIVAIFLTLNLYSGGFNNGMVQYEERRKEYLSAMQGLVTVITVGWYFVYLFTSALWNGIFEMDTLMVTMMFAEVLFHSALSFWAARERFEYRYKALVVYTLAVIGIPSIASIIAILIVPMEFGAYAKIIVNALFVVILCIPLFCMNIARGRSFYDKKFWIFGLKFNIPLIPHYLSGIVLNQADRIMIKKMVGGSEAGIYSLAYSASMVLNVVTTAINQSFAPWIYSKLKKEEYDDIAVKTIPIFIGVAVMIFTLVALAPECIIIFGGKEYEKAIWIVPAIATSLYFNFVFLIFANIEFYYMRNMYITYASVIGAILNIVLNKYAIDAWGYMAAGYTTLICYIIFAISHCFFVRKVCKECIGRKSIFNEKIILGIGILLIIVSQLMLLVYNHMIIRYLILVLLLVLICTNIRKIVMIIGELKK